MRQIEIIASDGSFHCMESGKAETVVFTLNEEGKASYYLYGNNPFSCSETELAQKFGLTLRKRPAGVSARYALLDFLEQTVSPMRAKRLIDDFTDCAVRMRNRPQGMMCDVVADRLRVREDGKLQVSAEYSYDDEKLEKLYKKFACIFGLKHFLCYPTSEEWNRELSRVRK